MTQPTTDQSPLAETVSEPRCKHCLDTGYMPSYTLERGPRCFVCNPEPPSLMGKVVGSTYGDVVDPTQPAPPAAGELCERPTAPGVWRRLENGGMFEIIVRPYADVMGMRFTGFRAGDVVAGDAKHLPRGGWRQLTAASTACDPELRKAFNTALQATKWKMLAALTQEECDLWTKAWEMANSKPLTPASDEREVEIERLKARLAEVEGERDRAKDQRDKILAAANKFYKRATTAEARVRELESEIKSAKEKLHCGDGESLVVAAFIVAQRAENHAAQLDAVLPIHQRLETELAAAIEREKGLREAREQARYLREYAQQYVDATNPNCVVFRKLFQSAITPSPAPSPEPQ